METQLYYSNKVDIHLMEGIHLIIIHTILMCNAPLRVRNAFDNIDACDNNTHDSTA
jgi:hypothetical protein